MSEASAQAALQRVQEIWPTLRQNPIRIVAPSAGNGSNPGTGGAAESAPALPAPQREMRPLSVPERSLPQRDDRPADPPRSPGRGCEDPQRRTRCESDFGRARAPGQDFAARILCVADPLPAKAPAEGKSPAPIIIIPGPNGLTIRSEDLEALDEFERLLTAAVDGQGNGPLAVFYLKYAKAKDVADELNKLLSGGGDSEGSSRKRGGCSHLCRRPQGPGHRFVQHHTRAPTECLAGARQPHRSSDDRTIAHENLRHQGKPGRHCRDT